MKILLYIILASVLIYCAGYLGYNLHPKPVVVPKKENKMKMDSVCATPHGHFIYRYVDGNNTIYVLFRNSDGYPISVTVTKN